MQVAGVPITEADLLWIEERGRASDAPSRSRIARAFCDREGLFDARGRKREVSVRVSLNRLARLGKLSPPDASGTILRSQPSSASALDGLYRGEAKTVRGLGSVELVPVTSRDRENHAIWRRLMDERHYLGGGPLCGAQMRFLVR